VVFLDYQLLSCLVDIFGDYAIVIVHLVALVHLYMCDLFIFVNCVAFVNLLLDLMCAKLLYTYTNCIFVFIWR